MSWLSDLYGHTTTTGRGVATLGSAFKPASLLWILSALPLHVDAAAVATITSSPGHLSLRAAALCQPWADPDNSVGPLCQCGSGATQTYLSMLSGSNPCPYTSIPSTGTVNPTASQTAMTTTTSQPASSTTTAQPLCVPYEDPDRQGESYCQCGTGSPATYLSLVSGSNPCPYTSIPTSATVNPSQPPPPAPTACTDKTTLPGDSTALCWDQLGLTSYVNDWWSTNQNDCSNDAYNGSSSFANCWYRKKTTYSPSTCDVINNAAPCVKPDFSDFSNVTDFWVTWSIYNSWELFVNLNSAITGAQSDVSDAAGKVVGILNPPNPSGTTPGWEYVLDALTFGLSLYSEGSVALKAAFRALPQSSTLVDKVYPQGDVSGTVTEWTQVADAVGNFCVQWADSLATALEDIVNDPGTFTAWTSAGQFTGGVANLTALTDSMVTTVGTYMTAAAINATGYLITRTANVDVNELQDNSTLLWSTGCGGGYDSSGICGGQFFYDGTNTYSLINTQKFQVNETDIFSQLFNSGIGLVDPRLLFSGALQCSQTCGSNGGCAPSVDSSDMTSFNCLSNARVCTWGWDTFGPFLPGCSSSDLPRFGIAQCTDTVEIGMSSCMPNAYLGGAILQDTPSGFSHNTGGYCNTGCGGLD